MQEIGLLGNTSVLNARMGMTAMDLPFSYREEISTRKPTTMGFRLDLQIVGCFGLGGSKSRSGVI